MTELTAVYEQWLRFWHLMYDVVVHIHPLGDYSWGFKWTEGYFSLKLMCDGLAEYKVKEFRKMLP